MHRVDSPTAANALPAPTAVGAAGYFTKGSGDGVTPATVPGQDWFNAVQEEIIALMAEGGVAPDPTKLTLNQLVLAIRNILDANDPNPLVNGDMQIAQRPAANINSSSFGFGTVDRWAMKSTGTITGGGAIQQAITTLLGTGGFALQVAALSASTAGSVIGRHRVESSDARRYKNAVSIIIQGIAYQDTGLPQNYVITANKANAQDNFSAVTNVATSANIPVASGVPTPISFSFAPGDVSNGLEINITAAFSAAIAAKNFYLTDVQIHLGSRVRANFNHPSTAEAMTRCRRYCKVLGGGAGMTVNNANPTLAKLVYAFDIPMRAAPTISALGSFTWAQGGTAATSSGGPSVAMDPNGGSMNFSGVTPGALGTGVPIMLTTPSGLLADAEL